MIDLSTRAIRLAALRAKMITAGVELTVIAPTDNLRYLLGFAPVYDERACLLIVSGEAAAIVMPSLNADQTAAEVPEIELIRWSDEAGPATALATAFTITGASGGAGASGGTGGAFTVAVDPQMRAEHLLLLQSALPAARTIDAIAVIGPLREAKDAVELGALQLAANVADTAMLAAFGALRAGASELEIQEVVAQTFGANASPIEFAIVGGGPHSAFPHHHTGARRLQAGDAVVIDIGGRRDNYVSDITRMAFIGEPSERYLEVHATVERAVVEAQAAAVPGATCAEVDSAAREVIADAGYGEYFVHRTGHGLGLSGHEPPWIMPGNDTELRPGVVHSIEPGIYLPGEFGVRLEEIVHITDTGCERFSSLPRDVHVVA
jgi:Xaa-Pro aminopeptidase